MMSKTKYFFALFVLMANSLLAIDYDSWAIANEVVGGPAGDSDNDGLDNLSEYAVQDAPTFTRVGDVYKVKHFQRKNDPDLTFSLEVCTDLESGYWNAVIASPEPISIDEDFDEITHTIPSESSQFFVRMKVTNVGGTSRVINVLDTVNSYAVRTVVIGGSGGDPYNLDIYPSLKPMFPAIVKVPDWVPANERVHPDANYYMYTAKHSYHYEIHLSWASTFENMSASLWTDHPVAVLDLSTDTSRNWDHVGAADVYVDHENQIFIMAFHGKSSNSSIGGNNHASFMATSPWGLNFNDPVTGGGVQESRFDGEPYGIVEYQGYADNVDAAALVAAQYNRVFKHNGSLYGIGKRGQLYRAPLDDLTTERYEPLCPVEVGNAWEAWPPPPTPPARPLPADHYDGLSDCSPFSLFFGSSEFAAHPNNPHPGDVITSKLSGTGDVGGEGTGWVNHFDIEPFGDDGLYNVFFYIKTGVGTYLDLYRVILNARDPDWSKWDLVRSADGNVILQLVIPYGHHVLSGNMMGDPYVFTDDGRTFLFFCYGESREGKISVVELQSIEPWGYIDLTDDNGVITPEDTLVPGSVGNGGSPAGEQVAMLVDNDPNTKFLTFNASSWVQYQFENSNQYAIKKYTITSANDNEQRDPRNWTLSGSNDGGNSWTEVDARTTEDFSSRGLRREFDCSDNDTAYSYYRLDMVNNSGDILQLAEIELFGEALTTASSVGGQSQSSAETDL